MPPNVRGRAACNGCRSRKQKCDEKRPICSRCRDLNKPCQWPGVRKRGPAKGYTEALEHRLRETERALLHVVAAVDGATLAAALPGGDAQAGRADAFADVRADKAGMAAYWERFPLSTPEDIMSWASAQPVFQELRAGGAAPATRRTAARFAQHLSTSDTAVASGASFPERAAESAPNSVGVTVAPSFVPDASPESDSQEDTFDMSEEFKEQYLW